MQPSAPRRLLVMLALLVALLAACEEDTAGSTSGARGTASASGAPPSSTAAAPPSGAGAPSAAAAIEGVAFVAITGERSDVLELTLEQVRGMFTGRITDWSQVGGSARPVVALSSSAPGRLEGVAAALGVPAASLRTTGAAVDDAVVRAVEENPGAIALVRAEALRLGVLALVVDGHDPYRDPAAASPIRVDGPGMTEFDPVLLASPGEVLPVRCADAALRAHGDFGVIFEDVRPLLERADIAVAGLDTPLTDLSPPTPCVSTFTLQGGPEGATAMAEAGIDVAFVNGNHMLDCWEPCAPAAGLRDTLARLRGLGVATVGAGENLEEARAAHLERVQSGGRTLTFAFLAYDEIAPWNWATASSPGTAPLAVASVAEDVRAARALADVVVVGISAGVEYTPDPTAFQREVAAAAFEAGASLVIGNHPHVVQALERRDEQLVIYAQGNFIFDQNWSVPTTQAVMLEVGFDGPRVIGYRLRPVVTRGDAALHRGLYRPELVDPAVEGRPILERIWGATDRLE